ncbi:RNA recognition motif domain-containing protein [Bacteroidota bacterium]
MNIFVGNLSLDVNETDLETEFSKYGQVRSVKIIRDLFSQASKGFGFVEMPANMEAMTAIKELNTQQIKGKNIVVNEARPPRTKGKGGKRGGKRY